MQKLIVIAAIAIGVIACTKPDEEVFPGTNVESVSVKNVSRETIVFSISISEGMDVSYNENAFLKCDSVLRWHYDGTSARGFETGYWKVDVRQFYFEVGANTEDEIMMSIKTVIPNRNRRLTTQYKDLTIYNIKDTASLCLGSSPQYCISTNCIKEVYDETNYTLHVEYQVTVTEEILVSMQKDTAMLRIFPNHYGM